jgi:two-component system LytT family response regulator
MVMQKYFFIKVDGRYIKISFHDIIYIEGCRNYIKLVTESKTYLTLFSMKRMEQFLPTYLFRRIHKSFIVSLDKITGFDSEMAYLKGRELPIGQQYKNELGKGVVILNDAISESPQADSFYSVPIIVSRNQKSKLFEA